MDSILYANGPEGLVTLTRLQQIARVRMLVLPEGFDNAEAAQQAHAAGIPVRLRGRDVPLSLVNEHATTLISSAFPFRILPQETEAVALAVNFHAAILPTYRGRHGNIWAMINDARELGVTVHCIDAQFDHGTILGIERYAISDAMQLADIQAESLRALTRLLERFVAAGGALTCQPDATLPAIYWRARTGEDSQLCWHMAARALFLFVRALSRPPIYAWSRYNRKKFFFRHLALTEHPCDALPGTVLTENGRLYICAGDRLALEVCDYFGENGVELQSGMVLH